MKLTPEQQHEERAFFEAAISGWWKRGFKLLEDGAGYDDPDLNNMWEGWLQCVNSRNARELEAQTIARSVGELKASDELRLMRQYSRVFTRAYDLREPVFVLRAQDRTAYKAIAQWLSLNIPSMGHANSKIISAKATMRLFMLHEPQKDPD